MVVGVASPSGGSVKGRVLVIVLGEERGGSGWGWRCIDCGLGDRE